MIVSRPIVTRSAAVLGLVATMFGLASPAWAQDHTADPYKPYNSGYEPYVYPTYPNNDGYVPNQGILQGYSGASRSNTFQDYLNDDEGDLFGRSARRLGPGDPYYRAYRQFDRDYDRVHKQSDADTAYYEDQQARQEKYLDYLRERDPKKRAQLYREYVQDSRRVSRDLAAGRSGFGRRVTPPTGGREAEGATGVDQRRRSLLDTPPDTTQRRGSLIDGPGAATRPSSSGLGRRGSSTSSSRRESPTDILKRSERMDRERRVLPSPSSAIRRPSGSTPPRGTSGAPNNR
jgi:hypothetical protein